MTTTAAPTASAVEDQRERFYRLMPELLREEPRRALVLAEIGAGYRASLVVVGVDRAAEAEYVPREIALDGADELVDLVAPAQLDLGIDVAGTGRVELLDQLATRPALVVDRSWDVVAANNGLGLLTTGVAERLLEPPVNALRLALAPDGMAPRIVNLDEWREHVFERLRRQVAATGDLSVQALADELAAYPGANAAPATNEIVVPLRLRCDDGELAFFSTVTTFGTPMDVMVSELAIESFFPADDHTRQAVTRSARARAAATAAKSGDGHVLDEGEPHHGSYRPLMSEQRAERIHQWHEGAYRRARAITSGDQTFSRDNVLRNGVADRVEVRRSDVFSDVDGIFDLIVFDPPFRWFAPRDFLEAATTDENYDAMTRFFRQARRHLADGGRMLIFFGTSGDLAYIQQLITTGASTVRWWPGATSSRTAGTSTTSLSA